MLPTSVPDTKLSVLSSISASCGSFCGVHPAREVGRDGQHAVDAPVAQVLDGLALIAVVHGFEGARPGGNRARQLANPDRRQPAILIDDADLQVLDVAAEGIAEDDELHDRHDQHHDDEHRAPPEPAELTFDDGPCSLHELSVLRSAFSRRPS